MAQTRNGSYTVEAAFVAPIVLGLAFLILYTLFLQHDRVMLQANLDNAIFSMAEGGEGGGQDGESRLKESLWCMQVTQADLSDGAAWIRGSLTAEAAWQIPVLSYFIQGKQKVSLSESYCKIHPEEIIRYGADFFS